MQFLVPGPVRGVCVEWHRDPPTWQLAFAPHPDAPVGADRSPPAAASETGEQRKEKLQKYPS